MPMTDNEDEEEEEKKKIQQQDTKKLVKISHISISIVVYLSR